MLSSVFPLDWLFSAGEPEPPSSPKSFAKDRSERTEEDELEDGAEAEQKANVSRDHSSGTDNETRTLLPQGLEASADAACGGAIPKRRPLDEEGVGGERSWQRRAMRRKQDKSVEQSEGDEGDEDEYCYGSVPLDLRERILEILSSPTSEECERELTKLREALEERKRRRRRREAKREDGDSADFLEAPYVDKRPLAARKGADGSPRRTRRPPLWGDGGGNDYAEAGGTPRPRRSSARTRVGGGADDEDDACRRERRRRRRRAARRAADQERERRSSSTNMPSSTLSSLFGKDLDLLNTVRLYGIIHLI